MRTLVEEFGTRVGRAEPWSRDIDPANLVTSNGGLWTAGEETTPWRALLDHYLEGWVEAASQIRLRGSNHAERFRVLPTSADEWMVEQTGVLRPGFETSGCAYSGGQL